MQFSLGKREEEVAQALMKVDEEATAKANSQKSLKEMESQLGRGDGGHGCGEGSQG